MDLATIAKKLENNPRRNIVRRYQTPLEFRDDVRLVSAGMFDWGLCAGAWPLAHLLYQAFCMVCMGGQPVRQWPGCRAAVRVLYWALCSCQEAANAALAAHQGEGF